jgi:adenosylcobinamide kinase/adenosylcobinamide-phosphate guanylyltransferase
VIVGRGEKIYSTHLILGGARSGKTAYALSEAKKSSLDKWMIVTAKAEDEEMKDRILLHRAERDPDWSVVEEPSELAEVLLRLARPDRIVVVDCLTLWLSNLFFGERDWTVAVDELAGRVRILEGSAIFVSNEIGLGLVPDNKLGRAFRDAHGQMNQLMAQACGDVTFVAAGLPLALKMDLVQKRVRD